MNIAKAELLAGTERTALAAEITDAVNANLPREKAIAAQQMAKTAQEVKDLGLQSDFVDGRGQAMASIPPVVYHRWNLAYPGCWKDKQFVNEFLADNPQCLLPGYKPPAKPINFAMRVPKLNPGGDFYIENKRRIAEEIRQQATFIKKANS